MNKFGRILSSSPRRPVIPIILILLIISYILPWITSEGVGLTYGGYDLAEWTSLHPRVYQASPPLITPLLLRIPPVCIAIIAAFYARPGTSVWWIGAVLALTIIITLLPPLEFISERGNMNYRQMLAVSLFTLFFSIVGLSGLLYRRRWIVIGITALVGVTSSILGLSRAFDLYAQFFLPREIGVGGVSTVILFAGILGLGIIRMRERQGSSDTTLPA